MLYRKRTVCQKHFFYKYDLVNYKLETAQTPLALDLGEIDENTNARAISALEGL